VKQTRVLVVALVSIVALTTLSATTASGNSCWSFKGNDRKMAKKVNKARSSKGKSKLKLDPELSRIARSHSKSMAKSEELVHTKNLGGKVTNWKSLGENIGYGDSVGQLHKMFMNSEVHKDNILKAEFRHVGVGIVKKGDWLWTTVIFESKKNPGTTLGMPSC
jgi:uncharacterized protein YkwD